MTKQLSVEEQETISELIERYRNWLTAGTWASGYWSNREKWESEIENKVDELKKKINKNAIS